MHYITSILAVLTSYHAHTYAQWLRQHGNKSGAVGIYSIITLALALMGYQIVSSP
ncbi:MAG TPA: hypothetical protein VGL27_16575 [Negativicutes bacterium]|jgi:hypothetical protein